MRVHPASCIDTLALLCVTAANPIWRLLGNLHCTPARAWQAETGQMLVDKRARGGLNLVALEIARAMQEDEEFWFRLSGGDKDTFVSNLKDS